MQNFSMTLEALGVLEIGAEIQYICNIVCGEVFHQFDLFSADVEGTNPLNVEAIILGLAS